MIGRKADIQRTDGYGIQIFFGLSPEEKMVNPSLLSKFRETRITEDILEDLLKETICQAIEKGLVKSGTIIVEAAVRAKSMPQVLRELTKAILFIAKPTGIHALYTVWLCLF